MTAVTSEIENDVLFNHIADGTETRWARFLILRNRNIGCIGVTKQSISKSPIAGSTLGNLLRNAWKHTFTMKGSQ